MIEQQGEVVADDDGQVLVRLGGKLGCPSCDAGRGCGAGIFGRLLRRRSMVLPLRNHLGARKGQAVLVGLPEAWFLTLVVRFYLYPLLAGLVGAACGHYLSTRFQSATAVSDLLTLLGALMAGAAAVWRNRSWSAEFSDSYDVHLLRVVENQNLDQ